MAKRRVRVSGAAENNLKNISCEIPLDSFVTVTGPSGSGKSSFVFDVLHKESERRFLQTFISTERVRARLIGKVKVKSIEGLPFVAALRPHSSPSRTLTVANHSGIYNLLARLFYEFATNHCVNCGEAIHFLSISEMVENIFSHAITHSTQSAVATVISPLGLLDEKTLNGLVELQAQGFSRVLVDSQSIMQIEEIVPEQHFGTTVGVVVDAIRLESSKKIQLAESLRLATSFTAGDVIVRVTSENGKIELAMNSEAHCKNCSNLNTKVKLAHFSFASEVGCCKSCFGAGVTAKFLQSRLVENPKATVSDGAFLSHRVLRFTKVRKALKEISVEIGIDDKTSFESLTANQHRRLLSGESNDLNFNYLGIYKRKKSKESGKNVIAAIEDYYLGSSNQRVKSLIEKLLEIKVCAVCNGARLIPEVLSLTYAGNSFGSIFGQSIHKCRNWAKKAVEAISKCSDKNKTEQEKAKKFLSQIITKLETLEGLGLSYLPLNRSLRTLSSGELQRLELGFLLNSGFEDTLYLLDEPSSGLHPKDIELLLKKLTTVVSKGCSLLVIDNNEQFLDAADYFFQFGPGAGELGGEIVQQGSTLPDTIIKDIKLKDEFRLLDKGLLTLTGAKKNNLKNISIALPLNSLVAVVGVSGSGKSSLIFETLAPALLNLIAKRKGSSKNSNKVVDLESFCLESLTGAEKIDSLVVVPRIKNSIHPRSTVVTLSGVYSAIRELFAKTTQARALGLNAQYFSYQRPQGWCVSCRGSGNIIAAKKDTQSILVKCPACSGARFNKKILAVSFRELNIAEVLSLRIEKALAHFSAIPPIATILSAMVELGLGYLVLGEQAANLSRGELQRVQLAKYLQRTSNLRKKLFIFDEPSLGLHLSELPLLLKGLQRLIKQGHSVIAIEHNLNFIKNADYLIELGPEAGENGGEIISAGTLESIPEFSTSKIAKYLNTNLIS